MSASDIQVVVPEFPTIVEVRHWASIWGDLLHVDMVLLARSRMPAGPPTLFTRRGLWEGAVIAYARTAVSGRRKQRVTKCLKALGRDALACHDEVMLWRNHHIAHRVDPTRETVEVYANVSVTQPRLEGIGIQVAPIIAPEEEGDLAMRLEAHVKRLRDHVWETEIYPRENLIRDELDGQAKSLLAAPTRDAARASGAFAINLSPSGSKN